MKLIENSKFEALNNALSFDAGNCLIEGKLESYSCKMGQVDKKLLKSMVGNSEQGAANLLALSPPQSALEHSPQRQLSGSSGHSGCGGGEDGDGSYLADTISTKTLAYLISTLNISFHPDYDFTGAKSEEFSREPSLSWVINSVDNQLTAVSPDYYTTINQELWSTLNEDISLADCEIYSYTPDFQSDPYVEDGCLWSFNYFFFNKKNKKLVFFTCRASSKMHLVDSGLGSDGSFAFDTMDDEF